MSQKNKIRLNKKYAKSLWRHSNDINSRKYLTEDMMSVGGDEIEKETKHNS
jgi:hypothetical protein